MLELNGIWFYFIKINFDVFVGGCDWIVCLRMKKNDLFLCVILCFFLLKDFCYEVCDKFIKKFYKVEDVLKFFLEYLGIFVLVVFEFVKERKI